MEQNKSDELEKRFCQLFVKERVDNYLSEEETAEYNSLEKRFDSKYFSKLSEKS